MSVCQCMLVPGGSQSLQGSSVVRIAEDGTWSSVVDNINIVSVTFLHRHHQYNTNILPHFLTLIKRKVAFFTLHAKLSGTVYCNRSYLFVGLFVCL